MNPEDLGKAFEELQDLNKNIRELKQDAKRLTSRLRDLNTNFKHILPLAKEIRVLNQIMIQVSKTAGTTGMIQHLIESVLKFSNMAK